MIHAPHDEGVREAGGVHPTLLSVSQVLAKLGLRASIIGVQDIIIHSIDLGGETRGWHLTID